MNTNSSDNKKSGLLSIINPELLSIGQNDDIFSFNKKQKSQPNSLSITCVINSIMSQQEGNEFIEEVKTNKNEFNKARGEYLDILKDTDAYHQIKNIYIEAINAAKTTTMCKNPVDFYFSIKDSDKKEEYYTLSEEEFIIIGRLDGCDFVSSNMSVSRINTVILKYMNRIYVFDLYSLNKTVIVERTNIKMQNDEKQHVIKFDENESGKLEVGFNTTILFTQKECIICFNNQRNILFDSCGHSVMCSSCFDKYDNNKCPICAKEITNIKKNHLCINTNMH